MEGWVVGKGEAGKGGRAAMAAERPESRCWAVEHLLQCWLCLGRDVVRGVAN